MLLIIAQTPYEQLEFAIVLATIMPASFPSVHDGFLSRQSRGTQRAHILQKGAYMLHMWPEIGATQL